MAAAQQQDPAKQRGQWFAVQLHRRQIVGQRTLDDDREGQAFEDLLAGVAQHVVELTRRWLDRRPMFGQQEVDEAIQLTTKADDVAGGMF